jgi:hypothetical protein
MFVNPAAADLHLLQSATAAIDQGTVSIGFWTDWDGETRPSGAAPDLGADEWLGGAPPPPPPPPPPAITLAAPTDFRAVVTGNTVQLTWTDGSTGETEYIVERALEKRDGFAIRARLGPDATGYLDTGLTRGFHRYRVRTFSAETGQFSAYSNTVQVRVR